MPRMTGPLPKEVLVVEDEFITRIVAADALADRGIMAWEAGDAEEALEALAAHPRIGLVFTDVQMPGPMNGLDLAHRVSVDHPEVELIVTSGAVNVADDALPDHGTFLPKPYRPERLVDIVAAKLDGSGE
jgi:DNA-binding NtrC family response regulator